MTSLKTPVPECVVAIRRSHWTEPAGTEFTPLTFAPLTTLPSTVDVQFGPRPWVPTCVKVES